MKPIYVDNAATTPLSSRVLEAMLPFFQETYGNPSSPYSLGRRAKGPLEEAREKIARCLGAENNEIFFTSGGTESDNWAIKSAARVMACQGKRHLITTAFEHPAVLRPMEELEREGFSVTYLPVHEDGIVRPEDLESALRPDTALVSIMYANNEVGTVQPIAQLGAICRSHKVWFHTDAVQAVGSVPIDVKSASIDLLSLSGHKLYGPKGVGVLYVRQGLRLPGLLEGGHQEMSRRAGTENVPGIVGLGAAMEEARESMETESQRIAALRDRLIDGMLAIPGARLNGHRERRLPGIANFSFAGVEGSSLVLMLDMQGVCAAAGPACSGGKAEASHVLLAMGRSHAEARGALRFSLGRQNTREDVDAIIKILPEALQRLRQLRGTL